jgi:hypothetical protein
MKQGRIPLTQQSENQTGARLSDSTYTGLCMISSFHHKVKEIRALLGYYTAYSGNSLPMFWDNLPVPSSVVKQIKTWISGHLKKGPTVCSETLVRNYHYMLCNISEKRRSLILT